MKLVESASGKDGELPAAETCALDEGEEDEHFDAVEFKSKGRTFLKKFKKPTSSKKVNHLQKSRDQTEEFSCNIINFYLFNLVAFKCSCNC